LVICILLAITGGQWMLLQSAAWAGMIVSNLRHDSLKTAVSQTFDGQHPCPLCKAIEAGKKSEKKSEVEIKITRIEFPPSCGIGELALDDRYRSTYALGDEFAESLNGPPLLQPPRRLTA
jgi:hypothetical protein